ncbi:hypothetical protein [Crenothrix polyspora]|uniref:Uncharacterized protein n=1 Tax=Crenothrix polyspora TaxID=360316 RepID=A0A1R4GYK5_9GAMM|nr:hypothetical protein [Crenothrix polyspora]SJM89048.1 conserved hypothetical protein [Crenothrix polyspora]
MNKIEIEDELRPEYDLKSLQVRRTGAGRKSFGDMVRLEPDVIAAFPDAKSVNAALRSLIEIAKRSTNLTLKVDSSVNNPPLL